MNRKIKNVIMCVILAVLILISALTIKIACDSKTKKIKDSMPNFSENGRSNLPSDFKKDDDNSTDKKESTDDKDNSEKTDDSKVEDSNSNKSDRKKRQRPNIGENGRSSQRPSMDENGKPDMSNFDGQIPEFNNKKNVSKISTTYYVLFIVEGLSIGVVVAYLFMSKFNKKSFKETFEGTDEKVLYALFVIVVGIISFGWDTLIAKNSNKKFKNDTKFEQRIDRKESNKESNDTENKNDSEDKNA